MDEDKVQLMQQQRKGNPPVSTMRGPLRLLKRDGDSKDSGLPPPTLGEKILIICLRGVTFVWDILSYMGYWCLQRPRPSTRVKGHERMKSVELPRTGQDSKTWGSMRCEHPASIELSRLGIETLAEVWDLGVKKHGKKRCLGSRELLSEEDEMQPNGKVFKKVVMGEYMWKSFQSVDEMSVSFVRGVVALLPSMKPQDKICIYAETRAEWIVAAIGAFKNNFTVVTLYANLGEEAVIHGLNETECKIVITSHELFPKFRTILKQTPNVAHIIYMEHPILPPPPTDGFKQDVRVHGFRAVVDRGSRSDMKLVGPTPGDIAIIMYTSGSTGVPKGVLLSHKNIVTAMRCLADGLGEVYPNDVYIAYLPLAHVLELMCETICFLSGICIGYSSPHTITSKSPKIKMGAMGDAPILKPTIMVSVPFALDRIYKGILEQVRSSGWFRRTLFYYFYNYKLNWFYAGYETPITDRIVMKKAREIVGGRVRVLITGGAALAEDTHEFVRTCLCVPVIQGYGLTETCACATCCTFDDMSVGRVGPPLRCCDIRLVNWEEGGYTVGDKPYPRGEVVIGGDNVAMGYYKLTEATQADFFEEGGTRWFRTGDVAVAEGDGVFKIIDRKKDLFKLQQGEYVSPGKVESLLKTSPFFDNVCVCGGPLRICTVALVVPSQAKLESVAHSLGKENLDREALCNDPQVIAIFLKELKIYADTANLLRFEVPQAIRLCQDEWTPDNNMVTAALKLRRRNVVEKYQNDIDRLYDKLKQ